MDEPHPCVTSGVVEILSVPVLIGTTFIEKVTRPIQPAKRKRFPHYFPLVPILVVDEARGTAEKDESDDRQDIGGDLALLVTLTVGTPQNITLYPTGIAKADV